jgi:hypothetical protein
MQTTYYEWAIETCVSTSLGFGDKDDVDHRDTYAEVLQVIAEPPPAGYHYEVALTRRRYCPRDPEQLLEVSYAYIVDGVLPFEFEDGDMTRVPKKFHDEVAKATKAQ